MTLPDGVSLRKIVPADRDVVANLLRREWGDTRVVSLSLGGLVDAGALPGLLAERDGQVVGMLMYRVAGGVADIVTINAFESGGVGAALIRALVEEVRTADVRRVRVSTTNDNTRALRFYQRAGFHLTALHTDAVTASRRTKPQIPEYGQDGIPIRDELELELPIVPRDRR